MQLFLLKNERLTFYRANQSKYDFMKFDSEDDVIRQEGVTWHGGGDNVAKKLISEIFQGQGSTKWLKIKLFGTDNPSEYKLKIKHILPYGGDMDVFRSLHERFLDNVKISVSIALEDLCKPSVTNQYHESTSTGEMTIHHNLDFRCEGFINLIPHFADKDELGYSRYFETLVTVAAHISFSDDKIVASAPIPLGKRMFEKAMFCDVQICAKDGVKIEAHKSVLSACSPVLEAQFGTSWGQESLRGKLDMSDVSEKAVRAFLRYMYYQDLEEPMKDPEIAYELLCAAHKYDVFPLEVWTIAYFNEKSTKDFSIELAFAIYSFVRNVKSASTLRSKTAHILSANLGDLENLPQYKEMFGENQDSSIKFRSRIFRDMFP